MEGKIRTWIYPGMVICLLSSCAGAKQPQSRNAMKDVPVNVIFETDMGNDIDDALALDMLYKYADQGKVKLLGISSNKDNPYSIQFLDLMNTWYGYPDIPLGIVVDGADSEGDASNYTQTVCQYGSGRRRAFSRSLSDYDEVPESTRMYRKVLSEQPDNSVTIISVGFSTNIARLLETSPDEFSPLNGKELIARKVKLLSMMAGNFKEARQKKYNVVKDIAAAQKVFRQWPTPVVVSPFEVGEAILYPAQSIENDFSWAEEHPLVIAYRSYLEMPYDRPTWDLTSVLYAVEGDKDYFSMSPSGRVEADTEGYTKFTANAAGLHRYLNVDGGQAARIREKFVDLISSKPANKNN